MNNHPPIVALFFSAIIFVTSLASCGTECEIRTNPFTSNNTPDTATLLQFDTSIESTTHDNKARYYKAAIDRPSTLRFRITNSDGLPDTIIQIYGPGNELIYTNDCSPAQDEWKLDRHTTNLIIKDDYGFVTGNEIFIEAGKTGDYKIALRSVSLEQLCSPGNKYILSATQKI